MFVLLIYMIADEEKSCRILKKQADKEQEFSWFMIYLNK